MPKTKISEYSATANSNTDVASINIDEGCAPSGINNAIRAVMGHLKDFQQGTNGDPFNGPVNGTVGATTANTGAFTTLTTTGTINLITVGRGAGALASNTAVGASALAANTSGAVNGAFGYQSLGSNTTGYDNNAFGYQALYANISGIENAGFGHYALKSNTTGGNNTGIGSQALYSNTTASNNTAVGYQAGYAQTTADGNALFGYQAGTGLTTGNLNSFFGAAAGGAITTGTKNTIVGRYNGNQGGLNITTASNYIVLSDGDGNPRGIFDSSGNLMVGVTSALGKFSVLQGSSSNGDTVVLKASTASAAGSQPGVKFLSNADANLAQIFADVNSGALITNVNGSERARIDSSGNLLVGTTSTSTTSNVGLKFIYDASFPYISTVGTATTNSNVAYTLYSTGAAAYRFYVGYGGTVYATSTTITAISDQRLKENIRDLDDGLASVMALKPRKFDWKEGKGANIKDARGFIAQEFETVFPDMIDEWRDPAPEGEEPYKAINANLIPTLVKAIQEQQAIIQSLTARITALEGA